MQYTELDNLAKIGSNIRSIQIKETWGGFAYGGTNIRRRSDKYVILTEHKKGIYRASSPIDQGTTSAEIRHAFAAHGGFIDYVNVTFGAAFKMDLSGFSEAANLLGYTILIEENGRHKYKINVSTGRFDHHKIKLCYTTTWVGFSEIEFVDYALLLELVAPNEYVSAPWVLAPNEIILSFIESMRVDAAAANSPEIQPNDHSTPADNKPSILPVTPAVPAAPTVPAVPVLGELTSNECVICLDAIPTIRLFPCGHVCVCADCPVSLLVHCPMCRTKLDGYI